MNKILIIGGGLGGLFTGALLAKSGYRVEVLEKNTVAGGGLQCFKRFGETFETGMHILGGFEEGGSLYKICSYLGIMDKLSIRPTDDDVIDSITYLHDGQTYDIPKGRRQVENYLVSKFPDEHDGIIEYFDNLYRLSEEVDLFYLRESNRHMLQHSEQFLWSADRFIDNYIKNPRLKELLAYMNPMYGGVKGHTPAYVHALINVLYINGSSRFNDGSQQLADLLVDVIEAGGGCVHKGEEVTAIRVENKLVNYVCTANGNIYRADMYISDIHPCSLLNIIDETAFPRAYRSRLESIPNSYSAFTVYVKFKEKKFPYINHTCYCQNGADMVWNLWKYDESRDWPYGFMYMTPPSRNQDKYATRMIVNCVMKYDVVEKWENTRTGCRGDEYNGWKQRCMERVIDKIDMLHEGFKDAIDKVFASSPLTIRDYYGAKEGSIYGFSKDCTNMALSQVPIATKVRNLLLTGENINLHGICGVPLTAIETVEAIIGKNVLIKKINDVNK